MTATPKGRELWLDAGQTLLRRGGIAAVRLRALTSELGLTTGSFYHHFTNMADYLDELARYYGTDQVRVGVATVDATDPRTRLRRLYELSRDDKMGPLDVAMRDWATSNPVAAAAVHDADTVLLRFIEGAFIDLGYPRRDAQVRAQLFFSVGIARVTPPWRIGAKPFDAVLDVLAP
jgi:AcrR family transcriptional regulator